VSSFVLLCVAAAVATVLWRYRQQRIENKLRAAFPQRSVIEVCLPRGITDSNARMQRFYRKVVNAAAGDARDRRSGHRQVDVVYFAEVRAGEAMPYLRFLVYADADRMLSVKRSLKTVFDGMATVRELAADADPMRALADELRPPTAAEDTETTSGPSSEVD
jgi:hypothetical protein